MLNMAIKTITKEKLDPQYPPSRSARETFGKTYGSLTVIGYAGAQKNDRGVAYRFFVESLCKCGKIILSNVAHLRHGLSKSCGCKILEYHTKRLTKHGFAPLHGKRKSVYKIWQGINRRCRNPNDRNFKNYGGRGIKVCERWRKFENFLKDMGEPTHGMSIERVDVNGNYCPENCIWIPKSDQAKNRTFNWKVRVNGEIMTAWQADKLFGRTRKTTAPILSRMGKKKTEIHDLLELGLIPTK